MKKLTLATAVVCSILTGRVLADVASIDTVLEELSGEPIASNEDRSRLRGEVASMILNHNYELQDIVTRSANVTEDSWENWRNTWVAQFGETLPIDVVSP